MDKLVITAAVCGAEVMREHNKNIPYTAVEIGEEAKRCVTEGASIIHLHVREKGGAPTQKKEVFVEAIKEIKKSHHPSPIIHPSTGGAVGMSLEERIQPVYLRPEMATLDCGTMNFGNEIFVNDLSMMRAFAKEMKKYGVKPEFEVFDTSGIEQSKILVKEGLVEEPLRYNIVLGVVGGMAATPKNLLFMSELLPKNSVWTVSGIGKNQIAMATSAILFGGHCRVGLEDNIYLSKGVLAKGSYEQVMKVVRIAKELGREIASVEEARKIFYL